MVRPLADNDVFPPLADKGKDNDKGKGCKGGKPGKPIDFVVWPLADNGKYKGKGCKGGPGKHIDIAVRPLADNGKGWGKDCKGGKPTDIEESSTVKKFFGWSSIDDFPEHKQSRAAELVARLFALCDPFKDMTNEEEERVGGSALSQKIEEAEHEREKLLQQLRELWEESAQESEDGSGSRDSSSSSKQARWQRRFRR